MKNKSASIGATMTWVVATIIILFMTIFFVYLAFSIAESKKAFSQDSFIEKTGFYSPTSIYSQQTLLALLKTNFQNRKLSEHIESGYEEFNSNFRELKKEVEPVVNKLPQKVDSSFFQKESNYYWHFSIKYPDKPGNFYFGKEDREWKGENLAYLPQFSNGEYAFVNLKNAKIAAMKITS